MMAPLGLLFDAEGLSHVQAPVLLYYAQDDRVLLPKPMPCTSRHSWVVCAASR